ncbi:rod-binding protein [Hephaestia sp. GCM10023244]|uniref:rod-binding protein n=1 Tax=unclassified Hephaestia TaxID=2631281 RepID=UPI0020776DD0|nr:rod-binding protein [Hephaestia sp. MAHUQ-44]MCM8731239.1 rod-binding protein [Hephaestia sp. MAHUQ-44]
MVESVASQIAGLTPTVSTDTRRLATRDNLDAAGDKFEAIFTGMMLKSMRAAKLADDLFDSKALDTFREMQDQKIAETMASHAPIGIGKAMVEFLARADSGLAPGTPAAPSNQGGDAA